MYSQIYEIANSFFSVSSLQQWHKNCFFSAQEGEAFTKSCQTNKGENSWVSNSFFSSFLAWKKGSDGSTNVKVTVWVSATKIDTTIINN